MRQQAVIDTRLRLLFLSTFLFLLLQHDSQLGILYHGLKLVSLTVFPAFVTKNICQPIPLFINRQMPCPFHFYFLTEINDSSSLTRAFPGAVTRYISLRLLIFFT